MQVMRFIQTFAMVNQHNYCFRRFRMSTPIHSGTLTHSSTTSGFVAQEGELEKILDTQKSCEVVG